MNTPALPSNEYEKFLELSKKLNNTAKQIHTKKLKPLKNQLGSL